MEAGEKILVIFNLFSAVLVTSHLSHEISFFFLIMKFCYLETISLLVGVIPSGVDVV